MARRGLQPATNPLCRRCAAGDHLRRHRAAGEEPDHRRRAAELGRADRAARAEQRRLLQRPDPRQRLALPQRHLQPNPGSAHSPGWGSRGSDRPPPDAIRGGYGITEQLFDASGNFAGTFPSSVPVRLQPTLFTGRCRISRACHRCSRHRRSPDGRRPAAAPDDPQLLDRSATERRVQHGRHRGVRREPPARPGHHAIEPGARGRALRPEERRSDQRDRRVAAGRLPAAYSSVHNRDRANERRGHRLRLHAGDGEPSPQRRPGVRHRVYARRRRA